MFIILSLNVTYITELVKISVAVFSESKLATKIVTKFADFTNFHEFMCQSENMAQGYVIRILFLIICPRLFMVVIEWAS